MTFEETVRANPFTPVFGKVPPFMAGREQVIRDIAAALVSNGNSPDICSLFVGARGTGKPHCSPISRMRLNNKAGYPHESPQHQACSKISCNGCMSRQPIFWIARQRGISAASRLLRLAACTGKLHGKRPQTGERA